ncbi:polysaccharide deacetylase family protein [Azospirillum endophyticum]
MLRIFRPNAASPSPRSRVADDARSHGTALLPHAGSHLLRIALLTCILSLPALSSHAAETSARPQPVTKPPAAKLEKAPAPAPDGPVLQLGIFSRDGDAWWSWKALQQRERDLTGGLTASVMPLDGRSDAGGVALYAQVAKGIDARALCRRIVGAGFGCLVVDRPAVDRPAQAATPAAVAPPKAVPEKSPAGRAAEEKTTAAVASTRPTPIMPPPAPATTVSIAPAAAARPPAVTVAVASPQSDPRQFDPKPAQQAPGSRETATTTSVLAPIGSAIAAPLAPPPSVAAAIPPADGLVIYNEEDARTMADIEQHSRRKGRLRSVMPDSRYDVMPATLKRENWNLCALTFDDGPHRTVTRQILDILNQEGVHATYFPVGRIAERQGELIHDFVAGGHEIGNHSLTHSDLRKMDAAGARYEIAETNRILREFGANPVLFRPPYGRYSDELLTIAREEHMGSVLWSIDTRDWHVRNADKIVSQIKIAGMPGNVFLMHSTYPSTAQALPRVIAELRAKGCEFVTLSEWLERARVLALPKIVNAGMPSPAAEAPTGRQ